MLTNVFLAYEILSKKDRKFIIFQYSRSKRPWKCGYISITKKQNMIKFATSFKMKKPRKFAKTGITQKLFSPKRFTVRAFKFRNFS